MSHDEEINGARIAAQILNRMNGAHKERLKKAIEAKNPEIASKIEENLWNFDDVADLTPQGVQALMTSVEQTDVVLAMKGASIKARSTLLSNMSERKRQMVMDDLQALPQVRLSEVEAAQRRLLEKMEELRTSGAIRTQSKNDIWV